MNCNKSYKARALYVKKWDASIRRGKINSFNDGEFYKFTTRNYMPTPYETNILKLREEDGKSSAADPLDWLIWPVYSGWKRVKIHLAAMEIIRFR